MKMQNQNALDWLNEDKKYLDTFVSLNEIKKFVSADFEEHEINKEKKIKQSIIYII